MYNTSKGCTRLGTEHLPEGFSSVVLDTEMERQQEGVKDPRRPVLFSLFGSRQEVRDLSEVPRIAECLSPLMQAL